MVLVMLKSVGCSLSATSCHARFYPPTCWPLTVETMADERGSEGITLEPYYHLLIFNTFNFLINIFIPYSFETVFYHFISACRVYTSLASCHHCLSSEKRNALIHLPPAFSFVA